MIFTCPITRDVYDVAPADHRILEEVQFRFGNEAVAIRLQTDYVMHRLHRGVDDVVPLDLPAEPGVVDNWTVAFPNKKKPKEEEFVAKQLTLPVVPETSEDGTKRLYKTRYAILEKDYVTLFNKHQQAGKKIHDQSKQLGQLTKAQETANKELERLKGLTIDAEVIDRRIRQIMKEAGLPMQDLRGMPLNQRLESFFGSILCHLRTIEADQDELAD